eukprot:c18130_g1_i2.p1 GENE.c18130_g1_i2~~c18130_g1_i2.p1  ORF type:complete len:366 (+),score=129.83 c18130_g1_i2:16-1113(+)
MDEIKKEIERKRKLEEDLRAKVPDGQKKKWIKRGDLEKEKLKAIDEEERKEKKQENSALSLKESSKNTTGSEETGIDQEHSQGKVLQLFQDVPLERIYRRLRALNEPITLFGETAEDRLLRLYRHELDHADVVGMGSADEYWTLLRKQEAEGFQTRTETSAESVNDHSEGSDDGHGNDSKKANFHLHAMDLEPPQWTKEQCIRYFFKHLIYEYEVYLENRRNSYKPFQKREIALVNKDIATLKQTKGYIKPLFKLLKQRKLDPYVEEAIGAIMDFAKQGEYVKAHDKYIGIAIGNAAWPIGVTMTGIHERSAREKIQQNQIAHILNDEQARKYLSAIKRLLTFSQIRYPSEPSKCFEYKATVFDD